MLLKKDSLITVLVVLDNDREIIDDFVAEMTRVLAANYRYYELLLVDNGSTDGVDQRIQVLQKEVPGLRLIRLSRRHDVEIALAAGLDNSLGDYVVIMNAAYDPPGFVPTLVEQAAAGFDVVIAERRRRDGQPLARKLLAPIYYRLASRLLGYSLQPNATHFRVFSRQVVNSISKIGNKSRYLKYLNALVGFRQTHLSYDRVYRSAARRRERGLIGPVISGLDIIISNSAAPLRFASLLGVGASLLSLIYCGYVLAVTLVKQKVAEGWVTTNLMTSALFFLLFFIITILSEYVARILEETKDRPLYFIEYETNSSVASFKEEVINRTVNVV
jgi:polyisoprenyl-phosphate glycosyltransferase